MAEQGTEQDKSEGATPFKLDRARQKGMLARGTDLGFLSALLALAVIAQASGSDIVVQLARIMQTSLYAGTASASDPLQAAALAQSSGRTAAGLLALPLLLLAALVIAVEVIQNRGVVFSAEPLKPDFSRLNPAKGIKRLFSMRMLKEVAKNVIKFALYAGGAYLLVRHDLQEIGAETRDGRQLAATLVNCAGRLLMLFLIMAAAIAILDQLMSRREFARQMRMSRREVTRESREREGEPRQKRKRKQIMAEIIKQASAAANVKGADVLITNPTHYAVALRYLPEQGDAPIVQARGRNLWAKRMRETAEREGITIVRSPALARALYRESQVGNPIGGTHFAAVADIYIMLRKALKDKGTR